MLQPHHLIHFLAETSLDGGAYFQCVEPVCALRGDKRGAHADGIIPKELAPCAKRGRTHEKKCDERTKYCGSIFWCSVMKAQGQSAQQSSRVHMIYTYIQYTYKIQHKLGGGGPKRNMDRYAKQTTLAQASTRGSSPSSSNIHRAIAVQWPQRHPKKKTPGPMRIIPRSISALFGP